MAGAAGDSASTWKLSELVTFGVQSHAEASSKNADYIVVQQIAPGSNRMSRQIAEHYCIVKVHKEAAHRNGCAFCVLQRPLNGGWFVADFLNVTSDRSNVDTSLAKATRKPVSVESPSCPA